MYNKAFNGEINESEAFSLPLVYPVWECVWKREESGGSETRAERTQVQVLLRMCEWNARSALSCTHMPLTKPCLWRWWNPSPSLRFLSVATLSPPLKSVEEARGRKLQLSSQFTSVSCLRPRCPPFALCPNHQQRIMQHQNQGHRKGKEIISVPSGCSLWSVGAGGKRHRIGKPPALGPNKCLQTNFDWQLHISGHYSFTKAASTVSLCACMFIQAARCELYHCED